MNYKTYNFSRYEIIGIFLQAILISVLIAYLFYRSVWGMFLFIVLFVLIWKKKRISCIEKRQRLLHGQFMDALKLVSTSLVSGMSMENAWKEAANEMRTMHGDKSILYRELSEMNRFVKANVPMEKVLMEFAYRTGVEDIINFAEVFTYGKRSGADWRKLIADTTLRMEEKYETEKQIAIMLAEKRLEQRVMSVIPLGMILFLQISSDGYMDVLYGSLFGVICMTICLIIYGVALFMAERIMKLKV